MSLMFSPVVYFIDIFFLIPFASILLWLFIWTVGVPDLLGLFFVFLIHFAVLLGAAVNTLNRWLESLAYRTWLKLFDYDVPEAQRSLKWKLWWNIMDEEKYADVRWEQWGATWAVAKAVWTRFWNVVWSHRILGRSAIEI